MRCAFRKTKTTKQRSLPRRVYRMKPAKESDAASQTIVTNLPGISNQRRLEEPNVEGSLPYVGYSSSCFGGRKRRSFAHANHAVAGVPITILCRGSVAWFLAAVISQFLNAEN